MIVPATATARVAFAGAIHTAHPHPHGLQLADGRVLAEDQVVWLSPFALGTIIALGLNYADHVKELAKELTVTSKDEPLVFLKGPGSVVGHRSITRRPKDAAFMHYDCELAVVLGRPAQRVKAADAMQHVAGHHAIGDQVAAAAPSRPEAVQRHGGGQQLHGRRRLHRARRRAGGNYFAVVDTQYNKSERIGRQPGGGHQPTHFGGRLRAGGRQQHCRQHGSN